MVVLRGIEYAGWKSCIFLLCVIPFPRSLSVLVLSSSRGTFYKPLHSYSLIPVWSVPPGELYPSPLSVQSLPLLLVVPACSQLPVVKPRAQTLSDPQL